MWENSCPQQAVARTLAYPRCSCGRCAGIALQCGSPSSQQTCHTLGQGSWLLWICHSTMRAKQSMCWAHAFRSSSSRKRASSRVPSEQRPECWHACSGGQWYLKEGIRMPHPKVLHTFVGECIPVGFHLAPSPTKIWLQLLVM